MVDVEPFSRAFWRMVGYVGGITLSIMAIIYGWN